MKIKEYSLYRVFNTITGECADSWAGNPEDAWAEAGRPTYCEIKVFLEKASKWSTICSLFMKEDTKL